MWHCHVFLVNVKHKKESAIKIKSSKYDNAFVFIEDMFHLRQTLHYPTYAGRVAILATDIIKTFVQLCLISQCSSLFLAPPLSPGFLAWYLSTEGNQIQHR